MTLTWIPSHAILCHEFKSIQEEHQTNEKRSRLPKQTDAQTNPFESIILTSMKQSNVYKSEINPFFRPNFQWSILSNNKRPLKNFTNFSPNWHESAPKISSNARKLQSNRHSKHTYFQLVNNSTEKWLQATTWKIKHASKTYMKTEIWRMMVAYRLFLGKNFAGADVGFGCLGGRLATCLCRQRAELELWWKKRWSWRRAWRKRAATASRERQFQLLCFLSRKLFVRCYPFFLCFLFFCSPFFPSFQSKIFPLFLCFPSNLPTAEALSLGSPISPSILSFCSSVRCFSP